ncbi:IS110 family transposase [Collinsella sp. OM04-5]|nr:IS110 family transposase [Collinsella sp. OM04-5]
MRDQGQEPPARGAARVLPGPRGRGRPVGPAVAGAARRVRRGVGDRPLRGAGGPRAEAAGEAAAASTAPPPALVEAENRQVRFLAARISEALDEAGALEAETAALLEGDETYACLLTVPGIGPRTAAQLAVSVDIGRFPDHDHLASYCGIAPRVRSSGTSVRSVRASRRGDARLKSLLIFSCNSLVRSSGRYGEYYRACRARGMGHGRALKAVARKRLRAIYAVMRDRVPYRE